MNGCVASGTSATMCLGVAEVLTMLHRDVDLRRVSLTSLELFRISSHRDPLRVFVKCRSTGHF